MHKMYNKAETGSAMTMLTTYTASEARTKFADIFNEALYGKPVVIDRQGAEGGSCTASSSGAFGRIGSLG
jgi:hypothetical protein